MILNHKKYKTFEPVDLPNRQWPARQITQAPLWCSVDLRDGNQALPNPMGLAAKLEFFKLLVDMGFKEIEVGFPAASKTEYDFVRALIEGGLIPPDVTIQVLTQARTELIEQTFKAVLGARRVIVHLYNSTSAAQREMVFRMSREEIKAIAVKGAAEVRAMGENQKETEFVYQYSPESFTGTELDFALEISEAVLEVFGAAPSRKVILNLPATVEMSTPNVHADQIEWFLESTRFRDSLILSVHPHNDRGTAVAAAELAQLAGAGRVEGTLFGNGERTGNADLLTLAFNLYAQGIDPQLNLNESARAMEIYPRLTGMGISPRHPYVGELVYTAFSGSHQDAIKKGMEYYRHHQPDHWEVPYLPIDPDDLGRKYEAIIRINSQSGKGGMAFVLENVYGLVIPKKMQVELGTAVQPIADTVGRELSAQEIYEAFKATFLEPDRMWNFGSCHLVEKPGQAGPFLELNALLTSRDGMTREIQGQGQGPIEALMNALAGAGLSGYEVVDYAEHTLSAASTADAMAYVALSHAGKIRYGAGQDKNITSASLKAVLAALNRLLAK